MRMPLYFHQVRLEMLFFCFFLNANHLSDSCTFYLLAKDVGNSKAQLLHTPTVPAAAPALSSHSFPVYLLHRMDENYNILPHGVNFQDAIFPDTSENRRTFSSLFQFSNCTQGSQPFHTFSPEWDTQEDNRVRHQFHQTHTFTSSTYSNPCCLLENKNYFLVHPHYLLRRIRLKESLPLQSGHFILCLKGL